MNIKDITDNKNHDKKLSREEIHYFIENYTNGNISDEDAKGLVRAIYANGLDEEETTYLTLEMAYSGPVLDLSELGTVVDKHSTGGVGDKVSLILLPTIAALGIPIAKMSRKGHGYTGGTVDKEDSIPGYQTKLSLEEFKSNVKKIGICMAGQPDGIAPADKKLRVLREKIGCLDSIPLIASSIMCKKIAVGASKIVLDVSYGEGAFMRTRQSAMRLLMVMEEIGKRVGKETKGILTSMEQPLGYAVGNNLEIIETINALHGDAPKDVMEVVYDLGAYMIRFAGLSPNLVNNKKMIKETIESGKAFAKFREMVENQGGDVSYIDDPDKFELSEYVEPVTAVRGGRVISIETDMIGKVASKLGAGRIDGNKDIDYSAGVVLNKKVGDRVEEGETLAYIHTNKPELIDKSIEKIRHAYKI